MRYFEHVMRAHQLLDNGRSNVCTYAPYAVDGRHQKCNWKLFKSGNEREEKVALIIKQHSQKEKTDQCLIQGEGKGKPLL